MSRNLMKKKKKLVEKESQKHFFCSNLALFFDQKLFIIFVS